MLGRTLALTSLFVVTALGLAIAHERIPAQVAVAPAASPPETFQLHVIPGSPGQWLILDTRSGDVQHWARGVRNDYIVTTLRRGKVPGHGWEREVLRPANDTGR